MINSHDATSEFDADFNKDEAKIRREQREDVTASLNVTVLSGVALWWLILLRTADTTTVINVSLSVIVPLIALLYDIDSAINYVIA